MALMPRVPASFVLFGQRFPAASTAVAFATLVLSITGANLPALLAALALFPAAIYAGQVWRLVTWSLFALEPISLIFGCVAIAWMGRDLCYAWGARRFLAMYFGLSASTGVSICLLALAWPPMRTPTAAAWAVIDGLIVAWALMFPDRRLLVMFVVPLAGWNLIWGTLAITTVFGLMDRVSGVVPHFIAIGLTLAYMRAPSFQTARLGLRYRWSQLRIGRRKSALRVVERDDNDPRWMN
jgi:membrane associated rhomboid family serine protease